MPSPQITYRRSRQAQPRLQPAVRPGFTLVEMLVATAVTLILLVLFAQMFQAATSTILQQRGMAQNDSRARMIASIIRRDLQNCTFRDPTDANASRGLLPLGPDDPVSASQRGYVYISENDVGNDTDDLIQFTVSVNPADLGYRNRNNSADQYPYSGLAAPIGRPDGTGFHTSDRNQPVYDDGHAENSGTSESTQSTAAEVCYFVRNGTLYRRVMLLRDPLPAANPYAADPTIGVDSTDLLMPGLYDGTADITGSVTGDFWNDFDFSAFCDGSRVYFNGLDKLANETGPFGTLPGIPLLAKPQYRFGFRYNDGRSREYVSGRYIGRFTMEETSHQDFTWPGRNDGTNPLIRSGLTFNSSGTVAEYEFGNRRGEDILLHNVDSFDVKIFDPGYGGTGDPVIGYADLGHSNSDGAFSHASPYRRTDNFGPRDVTAGADGQPGRAGVDDDGNGTSDDASELGYPDSDDVASRVFDTWHPNATAPGDGSEPAAANAFRRTPPFRPLREQLDQVTNIDNKDWESGSTGVTYSIGERIFPIPATNYLNQAIADPSLTRYDGIYYEVVSVAGGGTTGTPGMTRPLFEKSYGHTVTDNELTWRSFDNRIGISSLMLTVRFRDVGSNLPRQVTIIHSFSD